MICPICIDDLFVDRVRMTRCGHAFHNNCIVTAMQHRPNCPICNDLIWPRSVLTFYWNVNNIGAPNQANQAQAPIARIPMRPNQANQAGVQAILPPVAQVPVAQAQLPLPQAQVAIQQPRVVIVRAHVAPVAQIAQAIVRAQPIHRRRQTVHGNGQNIISQPIRHRRQTDNGNDPAPVQAIRANPIRRIRPPRRQMFNYDRLICGVCSKVFVSVNGDYDYICSKRCRERLM